MLAPTKRDRKYRRGVPTARVTSSCANGLSKIGYGQFATDSVRPSFEFSGRERRPATDDATGAFCNAAQVTLGPGPKHGNNGAARVTAPDKRRGGRPKVAAGSISSGGLGDRSDTDLSAGRAILPPEGKGRPGPVDKSKRLTHAAVVATAMAVARAGDVEYGRQSFPEESRTGLGRANTGTEPGPAPRKGRERELAVVGKR